STRHRRWSAYGKPQRFAVNHPRWEPGALSNERPYRDFCFRKAWIFLPAGLDFPSTGLDSPSPLRAEGELSGPTEIDEQ
ncbi:MAG TPA: hypothetical protein VKA12_01290, partial [Roseiarcus sp.]|nr:hypothetical protein [Roseiarcus sp.]